MDGVSGMRMEGGVGEVKGAELVLCELPGDFETVDS
jgi:hypothetical protein